ncbi:unnamed protein product [Soboliphyme baturini]|uniref:Ig-like domain-containing protein n=1 Tax=Soboliphyme baturini TaxID=241478 RepID=A0A183JB29_9BILA|nr:unnamed protein product [Soboliphyme baturini]
MRLAEKTEPKVVLEPSGEIHLKAGEFLNATCSISGLPPPVGAWYANLDQLKQYDNPTKDGVLMVTEVVNVTSGTEFRCEAANKLGVTSAVLKVIVTGNRQQTSA